MHRQGAATGFEIGHGPGDGNLKVPGSTQGRRPEGYLKACGPGRLADEAVCQRHRQRVRRTAGRDAGLAEACARRGLHRTLNTGFKDKQGHGRVARRITTPSPGTITKGSGRARSNNGARTRPMTGQPPGPSSA